MKCKHEWQIGSWTGQTICKKCNAYEHETIKPKGKR